LAEFVNIGLQQELRALVENHEFLFTKPFDYNNFKQRVFRFYKNLPKQARNRPCPGGQTTNINTQKKGKTNSGRDHLENSRIFQFPEMLPLMQEELWQRSRCLLRTP
jgi:hypothetical protein